MANYSLADIKALREKTGAGMMDVKKALEEAAGDPDKALEIIRVKGLKGVGKREGRSASDGLVTAHVGPTPDGEGASGVIVEINSETDFVAKNVTFLTLADKVIDVAVSSGARDADALLAVDVDGSPLQTVVDETAATLGEKIVVRRLARVAGEHVELYLHKVNKDLPPQVGVLVATDAAAASVARDIATHIAAFSPTYLTREDVPAETVASERHIAEETARNEGKPEAALPKIIEGRVNGYFKENVLLEQPFAKDSKKTVGQVLTEAGGSVTEFVRFRVGA
ncbi:translation elongation factor Ts [Cellulomonas chengniuliangii]|uniref:Elongation factor Ts n=1 Tax=Cellulomonas chengniuliangii TaxID=2968084 RepID=A0ABY5KUU0_9CELL|nr:translation elongation factor Ts [Cellulomonas chengniuliangii]MCC2309060.1 translation elongation factor Ts [Cellulomonas chengniuliangii]MCC2319204.1 translation elongation factor Ts [Cellulomonas chengniuliangii]MCC2319301.1 translation elongation factor Ts [Cellulomonas chengniuliangii]UUI74210.1 translation elongation factor Ts [Cellulomonas chengniuliangii]